MADQPANVKKQDGGGGLSTFLSGQVSAKNAKVKLNEMVIFTRQLVTMIGAGIPLLECLEILTEQAENPGFKAVLKDIVMEVRGGTDLSSAMGQHNRVFEDIYVTWFGPTRFRVRSTRSWSALLSIKKPPPSCAARLSGAARNAARFF